jgi:hypothetical protein
MTKRQPQKLVANGKWLKVRGEFSRCSNKLMALPILLAFILLLSGSLHATPDDQLIVKNLRVVDVPDDDGSGLEIIWEPLPIDARIISYRVYRGVTPDTLFFIGEIPVNPRIGVATPEMRFFDKDFNGFVDVASPGRLKKERGQSPDSPIYRAIPRDISVVGPLLSHFSILCVIPKDEFYFKTRKVEQDGRFFAGLKPSQMTMLKKLIPGNKYWYTVIAVDERRKFHPHAEPVYGIPIDNPPSKPGTLHAVYMPDVSELNFEWEQPLYWDDVEVFDIYIIPDVDVYKGWVQVYNRYIVDTETHARITEVPATRIHRNRLPQPFNPPTFARLKVDGDTIVYGGEVMYTMTKPISEYLFALSFVDYENQASWSDAYKAREVHSSAIPQIPLIDIRDRKNDKGDYLALSWGKPYVRITSVQYLNEAMTRLQLFYEFATNDENKLRNIFFEISDANGSLFATHKAFFFDKSFKISIPPGTDTKKLYVKMYFNIKGQGLDREYALTQELIFDEAIMTLRPQALYLGDTRIDDYNFQLIKRPKSTERFRLSRKVPYFDRATVDLIAFESNVFKGATRFDAGKRLILVDQNIDLVFDTERESSISIPIFASEAHKALENLRADIVEYQQNLADAETEADIAHWTMYVEHFTGVYERLSEQMETHEILMYVNSKTSDRARARAIKRFREIDRREFTYQMLLSDGQGLMRLQEITVDEYGKPFFMIPISNWFDTEKTPTLIASLIFGLLVSIFIKLAKSGRNLYIRPIAGIEEIDNAIGRATEMGRPILFCPGLSGISDVATLAGLSILSRVAKKAAEYDTRILVPCRDYIVLPIAQEIVREAHSEAGRPDSFDKNNIFFVSEQQFAYVAGVNGVMIREKTATNFYMGMFYAESLIMTETGNSTGAIQIAGTDAVTQIPFFITTCDYTLIGEELYAASAYMARQPLMLGTLKGQDYTKFIILTFLLLGATLASFQVTAIIDMFPSK